MKRIWAIALMIPLLACTRQAFRPIKPGRIEAYYTRSCTVEIYGRRGSVANESDVTVMDRDGVLAAYVQAEEDGSFRVSFCAGKWARQNLGPCDYKKNLFPGDTLYVKFAMCGFSSETGKVVIK